ncbi:MAG TPA: EAL domain-containing protein [Burkholderiales bacterium]|nr:EAL domain-containing protein [Burkholderiales bacterium]
MVEVLEFTAICCAIVYLVMHLVSRRRERLLAEARAAEARFRGLTELSADWFWETDAEQRITWLSGGGPVATLFGGTATYGKRFWEIPRMEVDKAALAALLERLGSELPFFDLEIARTDERGARVVHIISGQSRKDAHGRFLGYRGVGRDVTEQRRAERGLAQAKERLEMALDGGNLAEWHFDLENDDLYAGDGWVRFLGHDRSPPITRGSQLQGLVHPDDVPRMREATVRVLKGLDAEYDIDLRMRMREGRWKWLHCRGRVTERDAAKRARRMSGIVADIDARKRAEEAAVERDRRFRDVASVSAEYVWETDAQWRFTYLSERVEAVLGYARGEMLGRALWEFVPLGEERAMRDWFTAHGGEGRPFRELVHRIMAKAGGVMWQSLSGVPLAAAADGWAGYRGTAADVTPRKHAEARIEQLTTRDPLTGLASRSLLAERVAQAIVRAAHARGQLALLAVDLDRYRLVNEALGHAAGDALLHAVAERLQNALRREDTLARLGGDDFVLLWNGVRSADEAAALAQRILSILGRPFTIDGGTLHVEASVGIALYPHQGRDFAELLRNADAALYHTKSAGRGGYAFFAPHMHERAVEQLRLTNELKGALARGELSLRWHPVVSGPLVRGHAEIVGAEALVRWQHATRGAVSPESFVPLAEASGLIRHLGDWTLERALSQAGAWRRELPVGLWFAVNVSAAELAEGDAFVRKVKNALEANAVPGECLELEVTERVLMSHLDENIATLRHIGELGVRFAIDDFGTGYSSLAYLRGLPIHKLKIDRSFLRNIETDAASEAIARTIASLARTLGIAVVAEGVETPGQLDKLLALGCTEWQGHLFSEPLDAASFAALVAGGASNLQESHA